VVSLRRQYASFPRLLSYRTVLHSGMSPTASSNKVNREHKIQAQLQELCYVAVKCARMHSSSALVAGCYVYVLVVVVLLSLSYTKMYCCFVQGERIHVDKQTQEKSSCYCQPSILLLLTSFTTATTAAEILLLLLLLLLLLPFIKSVGSNGKATAASGSATTLALAATAPPA
jgi:hypothetical protein